MSTRQNKKRFSLPVWGTIGAITVIALLTIFVPQLFPSSGKDGETARSSAPATAVLPAGSNAIPVSVYIAEPSYISNGIHAAGSLMPSEEVEITTEVAGKVTKIYFTEGAFVRKGELLIKINDEDLQAQLVRAEFQEKLLAEKLERQKILLTKEAISREAYDQLETDHNMIVADIRLLKVRIEKTELRAPFDGVIGFRYVSDGSYLQPGAKVARIVDKSSLIVEFSISERNIAMQFLNKNVVFRTEGFRQEFRAQVYAVEPILNARTRTISLRARYDNSKGLLLPGMSTSVTLITSESSNAIQVPTETVVPDISGVSVWTVQNGRAVVTPVETGSRTEQMIEVLSGLAIGDTIVTTGIMQLRPNIPVIINEPEIQQVKNAQPEKKEKV
ncbi:MAG: efflux RND transporter periplasmic adaptor subunit [Prevotellaceae bacterium]|jgi:membrane fusion protein (multidrug efflux system)|nr:efflux RND transporter periplasmic adaptor subunit [Prevotellaceae bacterium]